MGTYMYTTSPAAMADVEVEFADGTKSVHTIHLYKYASKPYGIRDDYSERLVKAAETRFQNSGVEVREFGCLVHGTNPKNPVIVIGEPVFATHTWVHRFDDNEKRVGRITRVLSKPRLYRVSQDGR